MIGSGELTKPESVNQLARHREIKTEELVFASKPTAEPKEGEERHE